MQSSGDVCSVVRGVGDRSCVFLGCGLVGIGPGVVVFGLCIGCVLFVSSPGNGCVQVRGGGSSTRAVESFAEWLWSQGCVLVVLGVCQGCV